MANPFCQNCPFRARFDKNPHSLLGRLWRWHAGWCPGWRSYMNSLPEAERRELVARYGLAKFS
ncbi:MAG: hypothetical protein ACUVXF_07400 [Desulfobaccales bacterium]